MDSLLNNERPPVFCPGCGHEKITHTLDKAFQNMGLTAEKIVMVSDIGCSGLFDTFLTPMPCTVCTAARLPMPPG